MFFLLVFGFVCAEGALRLASQERATAVTQWLSLTEITTDLSALSEREVLSVGEITPTQIRTKLFCLTYLSRSLLFISGWGAVFLSSNEAQAIHCSVLSVRDDTQTHYGWVRRVD